MITSRRFPQFSAGSRPSRGLEVHLSSLRECAARYEGVYPFSLLYISTSRRSRRSRTVSEQRFQPRGNLGLLGLPARPSPRPSPGGLREPACQLSCISGQWN